MIPRKKREKKPRTAAIYKIVNTVNGKFYLGGTVNFYTRRNEHKAHLRRGVHCAKRLQRDWDKFGEGYFEFIILEKINVSDCQTLKEELEKIRGVEQKYLNELKPFRKRGYNKLTRANGGSDYINKKLRKAASKANKGSNNIFYKSEKFELYDLVKQESHTLTRYGLSEILKKEFKNPKAMACNIVNERVIQAGGFALKKNANKVKVLLKFKLYIVSCETKDYFEVLTHAVFRKKYDRWYSFTKGVLFGGKTHQGFKQVLKNYDQIITLLKSVNITDLTQIYKEGLIIDSSHPLFKKLKCYTLLIRQKSQKRSPK